MLRTERDNRRRFVGILVCILLGVAVGGWHNRLASRGQSDPVTTSVRTVTAPVAGAGTRVTNWFGHEFGWIPRSRRLDSENKRLRAENAELKQQVAALREADITAQRLRTQLGFHQPPGLYKLASTVISYRPNPNFNTIVIDRGSRDGVSPRNVVSTPEGLVGQVYNVTPTTSDVLLLTDTFSAVGAMIQRPDSRAIGVCKGNGSTSLNMAYVDASADLKVGDLVISSGLGGTEGVYPKGLPIGTVIQVGVDAAGSTRRVAVRPAVSLGRLEEVYVLLSQEPPTPLKSVPPVKPKPRSR